MKTIRSTRDISKILWKNKFNFLSTIFFLLRIITNFGEVLKTQGKTGQLKNSINLKDHYHLAQKKKLLKIFMSLSTYLMWLKLKMTQQLKPAKKKVIKHNFFLIIFLEYLVVSLYGVENFYLLYFFKYWDLDHW